MRVRLRVKEVLEEKGITKTRAARMADMANNTMYAVVDNPYRYTDLETLERIANALDVHIHELIDWVEDDVAEKEQASLQSD